MNGFDLIAELNKVKKENDRKDIQLQKMYLDIEQLCISNETLKRNIMLLAEYKNVRVEVEE